MNDSVGDRNITSQDSGRGVGCNNVEASVVGHDSELVARTGYDVVRLCEKLRIEHRSVDKL